MTSDSARDLVFLSHANPEDNAYTQWLATQLTLRGFLVWSDVTQLIGGEVFWTEIEDAIRFRAAKFILVLSRSSNRKEGVLNELSVAEATAKSSKIQRFILPVRIDSIPFSEFNVHIHRTNAIDSSTDWARGLHEILDVLAESEVAQPLASNGSLQLAEWWKSIFDSESFLTGPEEVLSNWFSIQLPDALWIHSVSDASDVSTREIARDVPYPFWRIRGLLVAFDEFTDSSRHLENSISVPLCDVLSGSSAGPLDNRQLRNSAVVLIKKAFTMTMRSLGFGDHEMANKSHCLFFKPRQTSRKRLPVEVDGLRATSRSLAGKRHDATWHFGLSAHVSLDYAPRIEFAPHVLFSDDGDHIWGSADRLHRARRSLCKDWWNAEWRDRLIAFLAFAAAQQKQQDYLELEFGEDAYARLSLRPHSLTVPNGYDDSRLFGATSQGSGSEHE